ncbi:MULTISPECIES: Spy/CpxP family protein refolding chaperone [unclassified Legionella]|uniref:Spy/CpxP family protein refolding chaperone n=1 Tax=unclassified Legionella TaxID=2622702 RepID=UPI0010545E5A|nr:MULTISPECIES: Spy/CpxP family protein refolding chaperone [unclassified Legionella]MDI9819805.1 Spy/CpxP family protein refolding chaperone [Legionella sp. PL877]
MKKISLVAFLLSCMIGQTAFAAANQNAVNSAQPASNSQPSNDNACPDRMKKMIDGLNMDAAQQAKVKAIKDQLKESQKANWEQMKSIRSQMHDLIQSDTLDDSKLNSLIDQKKELLGQMMKAKVQAKQQIYSLLNDQQKAQFKQMMKQKEENRMMKYKKC